MIRQTEIIFFTFLCLSVVCASFGFQILQKPSSSASPNKRHLILSLGQRHFAGIVASVYFAGIFSAPLEILAQEGNAQRQVVGSLIVDGEEDRIFRKARQCESDGDLKEAQELYEQIIEVQPNFVYAWANLGNVLTAEGNLDQALLCYRKAISLLPPKETLSIILVNKAAVEASLGKSEEAMKDLSIAERISGPDPTILTNKAVALSNIGQWEEASNIFGKVISTADRNALPWWLRYSMALLETDRPMEGVAFLQRTLNRFPDEAECKAFAAALYTAMGSRDEALRYWQSIPAPEKEQYLQSDFVSTTLHWGPIANKNFNKFIAYYQSRK